MDSIINTIRNKSDIVEVIGERIPLVSHGKNYFGVCPFHDDTNPSMSVSRDKQIYKCFSCGASGNVFTFLMNYDHMSFNDALRYLGKRCGVDTFSVKDIHIDNKYDKEYEAYNFSVKYYQNNLNSNLGNEAKKYLNKRGINDDIIKEFNIGLSLSNNGLTDILAQKYDLSMLNSIGLSIDNKDVYNDRIMFPLSDPTGRVVGFSGRIYREFDKSNKYLNTKETNIFHKGELLYHYNEARDYVRNSKFVIVMEGFMDTIRASSVGIKNTVSLMGTAMTNNQIELLKRLSKNIVLCLDGDSAGIRANLNNGEELLKHGLNVSVIPLSNDDDPDTFILKNGRDRFINSIDERINFSDYKIKKMRDNVDFSSEVDKSNYINRVLMEIAKVDDPIRREIMLGGLAKEFDLRYNTLEIKLKEYMPNNSNEVSTHIISTPKEEKSKYKKAVDTVLYAMITQEEVINKINDERVIFPTSIDRMLAYDAIYYYSEYGSINMADFITYLTDKKEMLDRCLKITVVDDSKEISMEELDDCLKVIREYNYSEEIKQLTEAMKRELDPIEKAKIGNRIMQIRIGEENNG